MARSWSGLRGGGGAPGAGLGRDRVGGPVRERHDRDHRVRARRGRERAGVADPHAGGVVQLAARVGDARWPGRRPSGTLPIWWAVKSRTPPARSGSRCRRAMNALEVVAAAPASAPPAARIDRVAAPAASWRRTCASIDGAVRRATSTRVGRARRSRRPGRRRRRVTRPAPRSRMQPDERAAVAEAAPSCSLCVGRGREGRGRGDERRARTARPRCRKP